MHARIKRKRPNSPERRFTEDEERPREGRTIAGGRNERRGGGMRLTVKSVRESSFPRSNVLRMLPRAFLRTGHQTRDRKLAVRGGAARSARTWRRISGRGATRVGRRDGFPRRTCVRACVRRRYRRRRVFALAHAGAPLR